MLLPLSVLLACTPPAAPGPGTEPGPVGTARSSHLDLARQSLNALAAAIRAEDHAAFLAWTTARDPAFASRLRLLYDNLTALPLTGFQLRVEADERPLSESRRSLLGTQAWVQRVTITWQLVNDDGAADHSVWLTLVPEQGRARLAGTFDGPPPAPPQQQPSWWLGPVRAEVRGGVTVVAGSGRSPEQWADASTQALARVERVLPRTAVAAFSGRAVVQVPASASDFHSVLGEPADSYAGIGAVAHQEGNAAHPATRIVVNPYAGLSPGEDLDGLLTHEMVHVITRSPDSAAPGWAIEGLAEWVALSGRATSAEPASDAVLERIRGEGAPDRFPADADFGIGSPDLARSYVLAWLVCRYVAEQFTPADLGRLYADLDRGRTLDQASRGVLGIGEDDLVRRWRDYLDRLAGRR